MAPHPRPRHRAAQWLENEEIVGFAAVLLLAGHGTTTALVGNAVTSPIGTRTWPPNCGPTPAAPADWQSTAAGGERGSRSLQLLLMWRADP